MNTIDYIPASTQLFLVQQELQQWLVRQAQLDIQARVLKRLGEDMEPIKKELGRVELALDELRTMEAALIDQLPNAERLDMTKVRIPPTGI